MGPLDPRALLCTWLGISKGGKARSKNKLGAPALHDATKKRLLWVVCNIRAYTIYSLPEVSVRTADNIRCCHSWLQMLQDV